MWLLGVQELYGEFRDTFEEAELKDLLEGVENYE